MPSQHTRAAALAVAIALAGATNATAAVTEFSGFANGAPADIAAGPDGALWFTESGVPGGIGRMSTDGTITEYPAGQAPGLTAGSEPVSIAAGPDGALWFTERGGLGAIGRLDPATGVVTEYTTGLTAAADPAGIVAGPDGNLWFAERASSAIGRITPAGAITEFSAGLTGGSEPSDIAVGNDGALWFTERADPGRIGRIDPLTGTVTEFSDGLTPNGAPDSIASASNGKLYFTLATASRIGRIKLDGRLEEYSDGIAAGSEPSGIAEGGDGALWFAQGADPGRLGRLWPDATSATELSGGVTPGFSANGRPAGVTQGPDGNVWFTQGASGGRIVRVTVPPAAAVSTPSMAAEGMVRLRAKIRPNAQPTTYFFDVGLTSAYGTSTEVASAGSGSAAVAVSEDVPLARDAGYRVRVTASNASGVAVSSETGFYVTADGEIVKQKPPKDERVEGTSTVALDQPPVTEPAPQPDPAAQPVLSETVTLTTATGRVRVKPPGASAYVPLTEGATVAVGSLVDARRGTVVLRSARGDGRQQKGTFWGSIFKVRQPKGERGMVELRLRGGRFSRCPARATGSSLAHSAGALRDSGRRRVIRRLWGRDHNGRFRTVGRDSHAVVRGTVWATADRCDGTVTRVERGHVLVRDLLRKRKVLLSAGRSYLARHRR